MSSACPGANRNSVPSMCTTPAASAAANRRRASAASRANGFSHSTCFPASRASRTSGPWVCGGVAIVTASTPGSAHAPVRLVKAFSISKRSARARVFSGSRPTSPSTSKPAARNAPRVRETPEPRPDDDHPRAHACPLSARGAGPLGPRSLLGGIPASRRSLMLARSRREAPGRSGPVRCSAGYPPPDAHSLLARSRRAAPGRSGPVRCSAGYPPPDAHSCLPALGARRRAARAPLAHAGMPAAFATSDSIVYWPTTKRISTSAAAS